MKKVYFLLLTLVSLRTSAQMNQGALATRGKYYEIPFTGTDREIHAKASLKGEDMDFMLDTGAPTFISTTVQDKYHFPRLLKTQSQDASGNKVPVEVVLIDTVRFGPFIFTGIPALVIDMKNSPIECLHFSGNIGSNLLRFLFVQFDLAEHRVAFTDEMRQLRKQAGPVSPLMINNQSDAYLSIKLNSNLVDTVHYDSGDGQLLTLSKRTMDKYITSYPNDIIRSGYGTQFMGIGGAGDPFDQYVVKPATIKVGDGTVTGGAVSVAGNDRSRMGRYLLNYGILQLNYPDSSYSFSEYKQPVTPPRFDFGFHPVMDDDNDVTAGCVWKGSTAEQQGMQQGDHIVQIDDKDFSNMQKCDITDVLQQLHSSDKDKITVTFRHRKQKPQTVTLERRIL